MTHRKTEEKKLNRTIIQNTNEKKRNNFKLSHGGGGKIKRKNAGQQITHQ